MTDHNYNGDIVFTGGLSGDLGDSLVDVANKIAAASVLAAIKTREEHLVEKLAAANLDVKSAIDDWQTARDKLRARHQLEDEALEAEHNISIRESQIIYSQVELQLIKERQKAAK